MYIYINTEYWLDHSFKKESFSYSYSDAIWLKNYSKNIKFSNTCQLHLKFSLSHDLLLFVLKRSYNCYIYIYYIYYICHIIFMTLHLILNSNWGKYQIFILQIDPIQANVSFSLPFANIVINITSITICIGILKE